MKLKNQTRTQFNALAMVMCVTKENEWTDEMRDTYQTIMKGQTAIDPKRYQRLMEYCDVSA